MFISVLETEEKNFLVQKNKSLKSLSKYTGRVVETYLELDDTPTCVFIE